MKTICIDRSGAVLYGFQGVNHQAAETMLMNDLCVWTYKVINASGACVFTR
ncbi:MAG: hypothetical protein K2H46_03905 [Muribaculaceae bacterium]|nr:hypothetical protein [Muribaculaceae bacterium]